MAPPVYKIATNKDYTKRIQWYEEDTFKAYGVDPQFLNIGYVQGFQVTEALDREVIREIGNEDIAYDLKLGTTGSGEIRWRMVDPTFAQYGLKLAQGVGTPEKSIQVLEACKINGAERFALARGLYPTRFSLTYARFVDLSMSVFVAEVGDWITETALEGLLGTDPAATQYAVPITAAPWSNLSGETLEPFKINWGSGLVSYDNLSFTMDVNRGLATNQPSGYDTVKDAAISSREITGTWTTPMTDNDLVSKYKAHAPGTVDLTLKAGSTPCKLTINAFKLNTLPRVTELGNTGIRAWTFNWQGQTANLSNYVA
jgi:hypothetical protein